MAEKLKECPFCGDEEIRVIRVGTPAASCIVGCTNCGAELESNEIGSGYYWNDRPQIKEENSNSAEKTQPSGETNTAMVPFSVVRDLVKSVEHMGVPFVECLVSFVELKKILKSAP